MATATAMNPNNHDHLVGQDDHIKEMKALAAYLDHPEDKHCLPLIHPHTDYTNSIKTFCEYVKICHTTQIPKWVIEAWKTDKNEHGLTAYERFGDMTIALTHMPTRFYLAKFYDRPAAGGHFCGEVDWESRPNYHGEPDHEHSEDIFKGLSPKKKKEHFLYCINLHNLGKHYFHDKEHMNTSCVGRSGEIWYHLLGLDWRYPTSIAEKVVDKFLCYAESSKVVKPLMASAVTNKVKSWIKKPQPETWVWGKGWQLEFSRVTFAYSILMKAFGGWDLKGGLGGDYYKWSYSSPSNTADKTYRMLNGFAIRMDKMTKYLQDTKSAISYNSGVAGAQYVMADMRVHVDLIESWMAGTEHYCVERGSWGRSGRVWGYPCIYADPYYSKNNRFSVLGYTRTGRLVISAIRNFIVLFRALSNPVRSQTYPETPKYILKSEELLYGWENKIAKLGESGCMLAYQRHYTKDINGTYKTCSTDGHTVNMSHLFKEPYKGEILMMPVQDSNKVVLTHGDDTGYEWSQISAEKSPQAAAQVNFKNRNETSGECSNIQVHVIGPGNVEISFFEWTSDNKAPPANTTNSKKTPESDCIYELRTDYHNLVHFSWADMRIAYHHQNGVHLTEAELKARIDYDDTQTYMSNHDITKHLDILEHIPGFGKCLNKVPYVGASLLQIVMAQWNTDKASLVEMAKGMAKSKAVKLQQSTTTAVFETDVDVTGIHITRHTQESFQADKNLLALILNSVRATLLNQALKSVVVLTCIYASQLHGDCSAESEWDGAKVDSTVSPPNPFKHSHASAQDQAVTAVAFLDKINKSIGAEGLASFGGTRSHYTGLVDAFKGCSALQIHTYLKKNPVVGGYEYGKRLVASLQFLPLLARKNAFLPNSFAAYWVSPGAPPAYPVDSGNLNTDLKTTTLSATGWIGVTFLKAFASCDLSHEADHALKGTIHCEPDVDYEHAIWDLIAGNGKIQKAAKDKFKAIIKVVSTPENLAAWEAGNHEFPEHYYEAGGLYYVKAGEYERVGDHSLVCLQNPHYCVINSNTHDDAEVSCLVPMDGYKVEFHTDTCLIIKDIGNNLLPVVGACYDNDKDALTATLGCRSYFGVGGCALALTVPSAKSGFTVGTQATAQQVTFKPNETASNYTEGKQIPCIDDHLYFLQPWTQRALADSIKRSKAWSRIMTLTEEYMCGVHQDEHALDHTMEHCWPDAGLYSYNKYAKKYGAEAMHVLAMVHGMTKLGTGNAPALMIHMNEHILKANKHWELVGAYKGDHVGSHMNTEELNRMFEWYKKCKNPVFCPQDVSSCVSHDGKTFATDEHGNVKSFSRNPDNHCQFDCPTGFRASIKAIPIVNLASDPKFKAAIIEKSKVFFHKNYCLDSEHDKEALETCYDKNTDWIKEFKNKDITLATYDSPSNIYHAVMRMNRASIIKTHDALRECLKSGSKSHMTLKEWHHKLDCALEHMDCYSHHLSLDEAWKEGKSLEQPMDVSDFDKAVVLGKGEHVRWTFDKCKSGKYWVHLDYSLGGHGKYDTLYGWRLMKVTLANNSTYHWVKPTYDADAAPEGLAAEADNAADATFRSTVVSVNMFTDVIDHDHWQGSGGYYDHGTHDLKIDFLGTFWGSASGKVSLQNVYIDSDGSHTLNKSKVKLNHLLSVINDVVQNESFGTQGTTGTVAGDVYHQVHNEEIQQLLVTFIHCKHGIADKKPDDHEYPDFESPFQILDKNEVALIGKESTSALTEEAQKARNQLKAQHKRTAHLKMDHCIEHSSFHDLIEACSAATQEIHDLLMLRVVVGYTASIGEQYKYIQSNHFCENIIKKTNLLDQRPGVDLRPKAGSLPANSRPLSGKDHLDVAGIREDTDMVRSNIVKAELASEALDAVEGGQEMDLQEDDADGGDEGEGRGREDALIVQGIKALQNSWDDCDCDADSDVQETARPDLGCDEVTKEGLEEGPQKDADKSPGEPGGEKIPAAESGDPENAPMDKGDLDDAKKKFDDDKKLCESERHKALLHLKTQEVRLNLKFLFLKIIFSCKRLRDFSWAVSSECVDNGVPISPHDGAALTDEDTHKEAKYGAFYHFQYLKELKTSKLSLLPTLSKIYGVIFIANRKCKEAAFHHVDDVCRGHTEHIFSDPHTFSLRVCSTLQKCALEHSHHPMRYGHCLRRNTKKLEGTSHPYHDMSISQKASFHQKCIHETNAWVALYRVVNPLCWWRDHLGSPLQSFDSHHCQQSDLTGGPAVNLLIFNQEANDSKAILMGGSKEEKSWYNTVSPCYLEKHLRYDAMDEEYEVNAEEGASTNCMAGYASRHYSMIKYKFLYAIWRRNRSTFVEWRWFEHLSGVEIANQNGKRSVINWGLCPKLKHNTHGRSGHWDDDSWSHIGVHCKDDEWHQGFSIETSLCKQFLNLHAYGTKMVRNHARYSKSNAEAGLKYRSKLATKMSTEVVEKWLCEYSARVKVGRAILGKECHLSHNDPVWHTLGINSNIVKKAADVCCPGHHVESDICFVLRSGASAKNLSLLLGSAWSGEITEAANTQLATLSALGALGVRAAATSERDRIILDKSSVLNLEKDVETFKEGAFKDGKQDTPVQIQTQASLYCEIRKVFDADVLSATVKHELETVNRTLNNGGAFQNLSMPESDEIRLFFIALIQSRGQRTLFDTQPVQIPAAEDLNRIKLSEGPKEEVLEQKEEAPKAPAVEEPKEEEAPKEEKPKEAKSSKENPAESNQKEGSEAEPARNMVDRRGLNRVMKTKTADTFKMSFKL